MLSAVVQQSNRAKFIYTYLYLYSISLWKWYRIGSDTHSDWQLCENVRARSFKQTQRSLNYHTTLSVALSLFIFSSLFIWLRLFKNHNVRKENKRKNDIIRNVHQIESHTTTNFVFVFKAEKYCKFLSILRFTTLNKRWTHKTRLSPDSRVYLSEFFDLMQRYDK